MSHFIVPLTKRILKRKARNRRRRAAEHLENAHREPPRPFRRVARIKPQYPPVLSFPQAADRATKRAYEAVRNRHWHGLSLPGANERRRGERRRQRAHCRLMAAR